MSKILRMIINNIPVSNNCNNGNIIVKNFKTIKSSNNKNLKSGIYENINCLICNTSADGQHFGVNACRACAAFFR